MVGIPTFLCLFFIWLPTLASVVAVVHELERDRRRSTGNNFVGLKNYESLFTGYPLVLAGHPAQPHLAGRPPVHRDADRDLPRGPARREIRGTRIYQSAFFLPGRPVAGHRRVHLAADVPRRRGSSTASSGTPARTTAIDWLGNPILNLWAVLVAASWRHVGYVMVLYLAGLKSVDPTLREAAAIDGANARQTFFRVVFPVMRPINVVIIVDHRHRVAARLRHRLHHQQGHERPRAAVDADHQQRDQRGEPGRVRIGDRRRAAGGLARCRSSIFLTRTMRSDRREHGTDAGRTSPAGRSGPPRRRIRWQRVALHVLPHRHGAASGCSRSLWVAYTSLRPYRRHASSTATSRSRQTLTPRQLHLGLERRPICRSFFLNTLIIVVPAVILILWISSMLGVRRSRASASS